jgi:hypothetical protein
LGYWDTARYGVIKAGVLEPHVGAASVAGESVVRGRSGVSGDPGWGNSGSVAELTTAIEDYLKANNDNPKPFIWTATAEQILAKVARGRVALQQV